MANPQVELHIRNHGVVTLELDQDKAPKSVANFLAYVNSGHYDNTVFHRVIKNFMIQGGDPLGNGRGGPGYRFEDEVDNGLMFSEPGLLAMANAGPGTNGSQFFITDSTPAHLNGKHTIFGKCEMPVVKKIIETPTKPGDRPVDDVVIQTITIKRS